MASSTQTSELTPSISHAGVRHPLIKRSLMDDWSAKQLGCELKGLTTMDGGNAV